MAVPHFDIPFRFNTTGHAVVTEQDTLEEISNCVEAILRTRVGQRLEIPDFGIEDPVFENQPLQLQGIVAAIIEQEPRAIVLLEQAPDRLDQMIANIRTSVSVNTEEVGNA